MPTGDPGLLPLGGATFEREYAIASVPRVALEFMSGSASTGESWFVWLAGASASDRSKNAVLTAFADVTGDEAGAASVEATGAVGERGPDGRTDTTMAAPIATPTDSTMTSVTQLTGSDFEMRCFVVFPGTSIAGGSIAGGGTSAVAFVSVVFASALNATGMC